MIVRRPPVDAPTVFEPPHCPAAGRLKRLTSTAASRSAQSGGSRRGVTATPSITPANTAPPYDSRILDAISWHHNVVADAGVPPQVHTKSVSIFRRIRRQARQRRRPTSRRGQRRREGSPSGYHRRPAGCRSSLVRAVARSLCSSLSAASLRSTLRSARSGPNGFAGALTASATGNWEQQRQISLDAAPTDHVMSWSSKCRWRKEATPAGSHIWE